MVTPDRKVRKLMEEYQKTGGVCDSGRSEAVSATETCPFRESRPHWLA